MIKIFYRCLLFICSSLLATYVYADDVWSGSIDTNWFNPLNWSTGIPTSAMDVTIDNPPVNSPNINTPGAVSNNVALGVTGTGTINIVAGGQLSSASATLGVGALGSGTAIISDANSLWNLSGNLVIGSNGTGTMDLSSGAVVNDAQGVLGSQSTSSATVVVDASQWNNSGNLIIGDQGAGVLVIIDGAIVTSANSVLSNQANTSNGFVTIDGTGSQWLNSGNLTIANGAGTTAELDISNGATVNAVNTILGSQTGAVGTVTLANAGSTWNNTSLIIGQNGTGNVTLSDSAILNVTGTSGINIGSGSVLNIGAADGSSPIAGGQINAPAIFLNSGSNIFFNHTDVSNVVSANISGGGAITQEGSGTTVLNGSNSYTGGTTISAGTLQGSSSGLQGGIVNNSHLVFNQTNSGTFTGTISGSGDVTKNNSGTVILQNANTYSGGTFITAGTLQIQAENSLGAAGIPVTFASDGTNATRTLAISQSMQLQRSILLNADGALAVIGQDTVFTPTVLSGAGNLTKTGTGTLLFNTPLTYTGNTLVAQGTLAAGAANIFTNTPNLNIGTKGVLDLNGFPQTVNNLQNNGVITLAPDGNVPLTTNTLVVNNNFSGNGTIKMTADLIKRVNDFITLNGPSSGHQILLLNNPEQSVDPVAGTVLKLVQTADGATFSGGADAGSYEYIVVPGDGSTLTPDPDAWYLVRSNTLTGTASAAIDTYSSTVPLFYSDLQTLITRMGDLRLGGEGGSWMRGFGNRMQINNQVTEAYTQNTGGIQFGADRGFSGLNGHINLGGFADYLYAARQFQQGANGATQSMSLGIYATWLHPAGWYADVVAKYSEYWNNFQATTFSGLPSNANYSIPALGGSIELGKKISFATTHAFFIEPQLQLASVWIDSMQYHAGNGLQVHGGSQTSLEGRVGVRSGIEVNLNKHRVIEPYLQAAYIQEFNKYNTITTNNNSFQTKLPQNIKRVGFGVAAKLATKVFCYAEYYYSVGKNFREPVALNIGLRLSW